MSRTTSNDRSGRPTWRSRLVGGLLALVLFPALASAQSIGDKYQQRRNQDSQFNLHASPTTVLRVNQYQCGLANSGDTCTDVFDSPTGGGGFWPVGSPNQYMFNSGLQTTGVITMGADCNETTRLTSNRPDCFPWSGDTVGAFFMDAAGTRKHATPLTDIYDSLNPEDLENWPTAGFHPDFPNASAMVEDTTLFNDVLIGRKAASQQDTWVMYWDGDPARTGGRTHPMGILVEQRTLAWNYPAGNEATIYFIYKFTNVTNNPLFQRINETRYAIQLPDEGWTIDSMYVAYMSDPDVSPEYNLNYATASFPFNLGVAYDGSFFEPGWEYPPALFYPPFFTNAPGLLGVKYLQSPVNPATGEEVGLTSFSLTTNGGVFPDPSSVQRGWRYHSLNVDPGKGDPNCTFPLDQVKELRSCYLAQTTADVRFYIGSGPMSLAPGQSATVALAQYVAATVATPEIQRGADARNPPGFPTLAPGCAGQPIRPLDVAMGYIGPKPGGCPEEQGETIDQFNVNVVPNSLLGKALVAQSIYDNKFLLGFAPETPPFYLVPGNNQVTVIWEPSPTEDQGDPFFAAAGDPTNPLYDPNYRQFDVEGYRIYRGTTPSNMQLIAQFDKNGTVFTDNLCIMDPEHVTADECTEVHEYPISDPFVQYTSVARLENGSPIILDADTALAGEVAAGTSDVLRDTGIPYAYVDDQVRNGFQYFYRVTAFDINSIRSGPSSLESAGPTKSTVPVLGSPNLTLASFQSYLAGDDGEPLETPSLPAIHPEDGTFSGPMPPTNAIQGTFAPLVERLLPQMRLVVEIDSIIPIYGIPNCTGSPAPGYPNQFNHCWRMHLTIDRDGQQTQVSQLGWSPVWAPFGGANTTNYTLAAVPIEADATAAAQYGIPAGGASFNAAVVAEFTESLIMSAHLGQAINRAGGTQAASRVSSIPAATNLIPGGSRWFVGSPVPDPARHDRTGHIPGIDTIWGPQTPGPYATGTNNACWGYNIAHFARAADVEFRWSGNGVEVWDVTHNVPVDFKPSTQASFGFLTTDANGNGVLDYDDFHYIEGIFNGATACSRVAGRPAVQLQQTPSLVPVSTGRTAIATLTPTGQGFGIYLNGERYIVQTGALPNSGTWTHRSYQGWVTASSGGNTDNPSGYAFTDRGLPRPAMIPNLKVVFEVENASQLTTEEDLTAVHTVPDPYYATSFFDLSPTNKELQFVNLPARATVRIYSLSGVLVHVINHEDLAGGGRATWNLRNRSNQFVASGVYLFHVSTPEGKSHVGKFTVVNSGFGR